MELLLEYKLVAEYTQQRHKKTADPQKRIDSLNVGGGDEGSRTPDLCHAKAALSQLSHIPKTKCNGYFYIVRKRCQEPKSKKARCSKPAPRPHIYGKVQPPQSCKLAHLIEVGTLLVHFGFPNEGGYP